MIARNKGDGEVTFDSRLISLEARKTKKDGANQVFDFSDKIKSKASLDGTNQVRNSAISP